MTQLPDREHAVHLLHEMLRIRRFEERCAELYQAEKIRGFLHLYIGEEGVGVGVLQRAQSQLDLSLKAASYQVPSSSVDGMDVLAVERAAREAVARVREGGGPCFLELRTYRFRAHSMFAPQLYRDKSEVEEWKKRAPRRPREARSGGDL